MASEEITLKTVALNSETPLVFRKFLNNDIVNWSLDDWKKMLGAARLEFRSGHNAFTKEPQWERLTETVWGTFEDFLKVVAEENPEKWLYFDYKYLFKWLENKRPLQNLDLGIGKFGFPTMNHADHYTMWMGTKGAHTPCHVDTAGCNLVFQLFGKKRWLLFPPTEDLKPTRVPYEESTIFSELNFFSPNVNDFKNVKNAKSVVLSPGDVLLVPYRWWHYVENVEAAISINVWLPLPEDDTARLEEHIVQHYIAQIIRPLSEQDDREVLNPNMDKRQILIDMRSDLLSHVLGPALKYEKFVKESFDLEKALKVFDFISTIDTLSDEELQSFLQAQRTRFKTEVNIYTERMGALTFMIPIMKAITHPEVVELTKKKLLEYYK